MAPELARALAALALGLAACAAPEPAIETHVPKDMPKTALPIEHAPKDMSHETAPPPPPVPELAIIDRPIAYDAPRIARTIAYRRAHQDPAASGIEITPRMIILHHTGGGSADATWRYFNRPTIESGRPAIAAASDLNVSAQFLVDRDGTIFRLMPETSMARHCVGLNHLAIGVENVGDLDDAPLTEAQAIADAALIRHLKARFPQITHLLGHHEYLAMQGHPYFVERDPKYRTRKVDPGPKFMASVRAQVADLGLEGPPVP